MKTSYKFPIIFLLVLSGTAGLVLLIQNQSTQAPASVSGSDLLTALPDKPLAPNFELPDDEGEMHTLASFRGKPVIINFWATWCPPCREELPSMNRAWDKIKAQGIEMIAVNVGEDEDTIFAFMGQHPINFRVLLDKDAEMAGTWPIKGLPTTFVIDKEGHLVYRAIGGREWDDDALLDMVRELK